MRLIFWLNGWLVRILCVLAVLVIAAMAIGVSAEVILRMFSFPSITGLIELTEYGLFISTFFMAPHLLRTNEHIRVDIAMSRVDPATARRVEYFVLGAIIAVSVVTGVGRHVDADRQHSRGHADLQGSGHSEMVAGLDHPAHVAGDGACRRWRC